jgi:hypothetical protein
LISKLPAALAVTITEQLPDDSVQVFEEKVTFPVPETLDQVTVPVGECPPSTVAVQVAGAPSAGAVGEHATVTVVDTLLILSRNVPEPGAFPESPS